MVNYTAYSSDYKYPRKDIPSFTDEGIFQRGVMEAKRYKVLGHLFFSDDILIWSDANITLTNPLDYYVKNMLKDADVMIFKHPRRRCIYQEFEVLRNTERLKDPWLQKQLVLQEQEYRKTHPKHFGLWECNFIIRRNKPEVNDLFNDWWAEICRWQWRDQVSFPYVLNKHPKVRMSDYQGSDIRKRDDFIYLNHY